VISVKPGNAHIQIHLKEILGRTLEFKLRIVGDLYLLLNRKTNLNSSIVQLMLNKLKVIIRLISSLSGKQ
jgi:hypothetical protein